MKVFVLYSVKPTFVIILMFIEYHDETDGTKVDILYLWEKKILQKL